MNHHQRNCVLIDIDHSLSNAFHRDPMIGVSTWDEYHAASGEDAPLHDTVKLVNALRSHGFTLIGLTARPEKWRGLTMNWCVEHGIDLDELLMRPNEGFQPAPELKLILAKKRFGDEQGLRDHVAFIIDDREDVVAAFWGIGVSCLQIFARRD
jgi:hypothetical protein